MVTLVLPHCKFFFSTILHCFPQQNHFLIENFSYVVSSIFGTDVAPSESDIIGAISCVIYSLFLLVTVKYVIFILIADAQGEGLCFYI
jgi:uncharacterized membrane protein YesL